MKKLLKHYNFKLNILLDNTTDNKFGIICRNLYFDIYINKKYFLILHKYKINKCDNIEHELTDDIKNRPNDLLKYNKSLSYEYSLDLIYDLKNGDLTKI